MHFREQAAQDRRDFRWWALTTPGQPSASCPRPAEAALKVDAAHAQLCLLAASRRLGGVASVTVTASGFRVRGRSACVLAPVSQSRSSGGAAEVEVLLSQGLAPRMIQPWA